MVLEFVSGGELWEKIVSNGMLYEAQAQCFLKQILAATDYMHSNGVIHRDLKPENLLCASDGPFCLIKVTDFGLAKDYGMESNVRTPCGTPSYVAPEVFLAQPYDSKCDVWSIGVILYAMVSGYLPFDG